MMKIDEIYTKWDVKLQKHDDINVVILSGILLSKLLLWISTGDFALGINQLAMSINIWMDS